MTQEVYGYETKTDKLGREWVKCPRCKRWLPNWSTLGANENPCRYCGADFRSSR